MNRNNKSLGKEQLGFVLGSVLFLVLFHNVVNLSEQNLFVFHNFGVWFFLLYVLFWTIPLLCLASIFTDCLVVPSMKFFKLI